MIKLLLKALLVILALPKISSVAYGQSTIVDQYILSKKDTFNVFRAKGINSPSSMAVFVNVKEGYIELIGFDKRIWVVDGLKGRLLIDKNTNDTLGTVGSEGIYLRDGSTLSWHKADETSFTLKTNGKETLKLEVLKKGKKRQLNFIAESNLKERELLKLFTLFKLVEEINHEKVVSKNKSNRVYVIVGSILLAAMMFAISSIGGM